MVTLTGKDGKTTHKLIHRLVAYAFLGDPGPGYDVNHKDGNKRNNIADNLEWCTRKENVRHAFRTGLMAPHHNQSNKKKVEVSKHGFTKVFNSISEAASFIGVAQSGVSRACSGRLPRTGGYFCRFL